MQLPSTESLLAAWEAAQAEPDNVHRALALLAAASPDVPRRSLADLSVGERDAQLLDLQELAFGSRLSGLALCPRCSERVELQMNVSDIRDHPVKHGTGSLHMRQADFEIEFRLPTSRDLAGLSQVNNVDEARHVLLDRVLLEARHRGKRVPLRALPETIIASLEREMAAQDPQGEVLLNLRCESCQNQWQMLFDIVSFLWSEIDAWAVRLLRDVHSLARAYGWQEAHILSMSPWRRQCYLEMLGL
jgi:hypothetical protein